MHEKNIYTCLFDFNICAHMNIAGTTGVALQESAWASEKVALDEKKQATTQCTIRGLPPSEESASAKTLCAGVGGAWELKASGYMFGNYQKKESSSRELRR